MINHVLRHDFLAEDANYIEPKLESHERSQHATKLTKCNPS